jgi:hypothetical protein
MYGAVGPVSYPTRALNSAAFQSNTTPASNASSASHTQQASTHSTNKPTQRRVFTGTVTKLQDNFGFVDEDVFFQTRLVYVRFNQFIFFVMKEHLL